MRKDLCITASVLFFLLLSSLCNAVPSVSGEAGPDISPPVIAHTPVRTAEEGDAIEIRASITDDTKVEGTYLFYRRAGEASFVQLSLPKCPTCASSYDATIPAEVVDVAWIEYYITASDGTNVATMPAEGTPPFNITVNLRPTIVETNMQFNVTSNSVQVSWNQSDDPDFKNYHLCISSTSGVLGSVVFSSTSRASIQFTVTGLASNTTYFFTVRVFNSTGLYYQSTQRSATTLPQPSGLPSQLMDTATVLVLALAILVALAAVFLIRKKPEPSSPIVSEHGPEAGPSAPSTRPSGWRTSPCPSRRPC